MLLRRVAALSNRGGLYRSIDGHRLIRASMDGFKIEARSLSEFSVNDEAVMLRIKKIVNEHPVVLFLKGTKEAPQCGYSLATLRILEAAGVKSIKDVNVLQDDEIMKGVKKYSKWPTIPQVYITGDFLGGYDIAFAMYKSGELRQFLIERNIVDPTCS